MTDTHRHDEATTSGAPVPAGDEDPGSGGRAPGDPPCPSPP
jgi:hypothetical protein